MLIAATQWKGQACFYSSRKRPDLNLYWAAPSSHWKIPTENWYDSLYEKKHRKRVIIEIKQRKKSTWGYKYRKLRRKEDRKKSLHLNLKVAAGKEDTTTFINNNYPSMCVVFLCDWPTTGIYTIERKKNQQHLHYLIIYLIGGKH